MYGKKLYAFVLIFMTLIAALGVWTIIDGAVAYRNRTILEDAVRPSDRQSCIYSEWVWKA